jgi:hypothetical protein
MYTGLKVEGTNIAPNIVWHVPGHNPISGTYNGFKEYTKLMPSRMEPLTCWDCTLEEVHGQRQLCHDHVSLAGQA